jgi:hypothetical protein
LRAAGAGGVAGVYVVAADVVGAIRKAKTESKRSLRTEATRVVVADTPQRLASLRPALDDVREAARARDFELVDAEMFKVDVELVADEA